MESKEGVLIDQGGYFEGTLEKMERVIEEYVKLEESVLVEVFTLLLKREPTVKDMKVLKPRKIFKIGEDNFYGLEIWLGRKWILIGQMERRISIERGTYVVRFHPDGAVEKTLVKAMKEMKVGTEAQGLINRDLDGVVIGEPIWKEMAGYRLNAYFVGWLDNVTIEISVNGEKKKCPATGWKRWEEGNVPK